MPLVLVPVLDFGSRPFHPPFSGDGDDDCHDGFLLALPIGVARTTKPIPQCRSSVSLPSGNTCSALDKPDSEKYTSDSDLEILNL